MARYPGSARPGAVQDLSRQRHPHYEAGPPVVGGAGFANQSRESAGLCGATRPLPLERLLLNCRGNGRVAPHKTPALTALIREWARSRGKALPLGRKLCPRRAYCPRQAAVRIVAIQEALSLRIPFQRAAHLDRNLAEQAE